MSMSCYWLLVVWALGVCADLPETEELRNEMMNMRRQYDMEIADLRREMKGKSIAV